MSAFHECHVRSCFCAAPAKRNRANYYCMHFDVKYNFKLNFLKKRNLFISIQNLEIDSAAEYCSVFE